MSPFRAIPRAPQENTSSGPVSSTTTSAPGTSRTTSSSSISRSTSWDTRVGSPVYSTYHPVTPSQTVTTPDSFQSSPGGLLSSKPGVAGLCVGIAVVCILAIAFFIYRVKFRESPKRAKVPSPKSSLPPSLTKAAPSPSPLGSQTPRSIQDDVSRKNSSGSPRPSDLSSRAYRPGDVLDISSIGYQHSYSSVTPSISASAYALAQRRSESGVVGLINEYHPLDRLSSATAVSLVDSSSYTSRSHLIPQPQVITHDTKPQNAARRPLPVPPHPPPAYEQIPGAKPLEILATIPDTESKSLAHSYAETDPLTGSTLSGIQSPNVKSQFHKKEGSVIDSRHSGSPSHIARAAPVASPSQAKNAGVDALYDEPAFLRRSRRSKDYNPKDRMEDHLAVDMENALTPRSRQRRLSSEDQGPFSNMNYELPVWLSSDPYPAQALRPSASEPSLYGATTRSIAASSRLLPSDSSIRTLTPEPSSPPLPPLPAEAPGVMGPDRHDRLRYSHAPTYTSSALSYRPRSAIVGDGPPVDDVLVFHGAERSGWAESSPFRSITSISRNRRHFPTDGFEPEDLHPTARTKRIDAPTLSPDMAGSGSRSVTADREVTFMDLTPLSDAIPGQGLGRAFSLDAPRRRAFGARDRGGRASGSPGLVRTFSHFSSLQSSSQGARTGIMSTFEGSGWLDKDRLPPSAGSNRVADRGRGSMAPSSNILPSEVASIRSISPEIGWMGHPESAHGHGDDNYQGRELAVIQETEPSDSNHTADPETATARKVTRASGRGSRMSIGEDGILWGRLTSAMEQE